MKIKTKIKISSYIVKKIFLFFMVYNIALASTQTTKPLEKVSIQFQWFDQFEFAGYYIAKEKGFYKDVGLEVEFKQYKPNINIIKDVVNDNTTYGIGGSELIIELSRNKNITLLYPTFQSSPLVFLTTPKSKIKTIEDFKNKKIMLAKNVNESATLNGLLKQHNLKFSDLNIIPHNFKIDDLIDQKVDIMQAYISNEPYTLIQKGIKPIIFDPKNYGFDTYSNIVFTSLYEIRYHKQRAINFKNASIKGWIYAFSHIDETIELILKKYNSQHKSKYALKYEAQELKKLAFFNNKSIGNIDIKKLYRIYDLYNLMGFIPNKTIDISKYILNDTQQNININFTPFEKLWIKNHKIKIATTKCWEPFTFNSKENKVSGISIDYWNLIAQKSGLKFTLKELDNFTEVLNGIKTKQYDITIATTKTKERSKYAIFTKTYEKFPIAIATKKNQNYIAKLEMLNNKTIAVGKNYSAYKLIKDRFPNIKFIFTKNTTEALKLVSKGKAFGAIDIEPALFYQIQTNHFDNLRITGSTNINFCLQIMIRDDYKVLQSILNKTITTINKDEMITIYKKWVTLEAYNNTDYTIIKQIMYITIIIFLIIVYRQYMLKKYNKNLQKTVQKAIEETTQKNKALLRQQKKLEESLLNFQYLLDTAMETIVIFDQHQNIIQSNLAGVKMFGAKDINSVLGLNMKEFIPPYEYEKVANAFKQEKSHPYEMELYRMDNSKFPALVSGQNMKKNQVTYRITTIIDLSDVKKKDELIQQQSKLALMGEMISMIAHQWRQPLNIIGVINMKLETKLEFEDCITAQSYAPISKDITKQLEFMSKTIDDFRSFFKPNKELQDITYTQLVQNTLGIIEASVLNKNITIIKELNCAKVLRTYSNEIMQVILNLIKNAEDALVENQISEPYIKIISYQNNNKAMLQIIDNAGGIPNNIIDKIFDPYFSTKLEKHGTGLGLYMSKIIVEEHCKGILSVENKNEGAIFTITLPLS